MKKIYVVSQTTFNSLKFDELVEMIKEKVNMEVVIDKTICNATNERQEETKELSKNVDTMIIVGGKNSSNTKELEIIAKKYCNNVMLIQNKDDIDISNLKGNNIGIMAGASTPNIVVEEIVEKIKSRV